MKSFIAAIAAAALLAAASPAVAQSAPDYRPGAAVTQANPQPVRLRCWNGTAWADCTLSGGGGGGSGDASAANQATQITAANLTNTRLGDITTPAAGSVNARLEAMRALLAGTLTVDTVIRATPVNRGATVGTTAVTLAAANASRRGFAIQVQSTTASCYVSTIATATADFNALLVAPGAYYETPPTHTGTGAISVICTAAGTAVYAREW